MDIKSVKAMRAFRVSCPGFETRATEDGTDVRPWLDTPVAAPHPDGAVRLVLAEWAEQWPSLSWPEKVELDVLYTHRPDGRPTRLTHPARMVARLNK